MKDSESSMGCGAGGCRQEARAGGSERQPGLTLWQRLGWWPGGESRGVGGVEGVGSWHKPPEALVRGGETRREPPSSA